MPSRSTPKETALLTKLNRLPVSTRRILQLRQFDLSNFHVLCWHHGVTRRGRRYSMQCDVIEDGSVAVSFRPVVGVKSLRMPKAKHFPGQIAR